MAVGSVYNVDVLSMFHTGDKDAVWCSFVSLVHSVLGLCLVMLLQFGVSRFSICIDVLYFSCLCSLYLCAAFIWRNNNNHGLAYLRSFLRNAQNN